MADTAVTISPTAVSPLSEQERAATGCNIKYVIPYTTLAVGATGATDTVTVTLGATPASWYIDKALLRIGTAFAGITGATINVGTTSSTSALITAQSLLTAGMLPMASTVPIMTNANATASRSLVAIFTAAGTGGPPGLTAGQMSIYLNIQNTADLP
jgi:hypothetical protein